jgi:cobalt-zinc-cadmium efflux system outer membrane protein
MNWPRWGVLAVALAAGALATGCALRPPGEREERQRIAEAGRPYVEVELLEVPLLPENPSPQEYVHCALLANAELQARYWEWAAAIEQVPQLSSWPNVALPFSFVLSPAGTGLWERTTLGLTNDPMTDIPFPTKLSTAGRQALEEARAAGLRFEAAKFLLQGSVLSAYYDLALLAESLRIQEESVPLLRLIARQAAVRVQTATGSQPDLLRAQTELDLAENDLANLRSQVAPAVAKLNALLGRPADARVPLPAALPPARSLSLPDDQVIQLGSQRNPELAALARDIAGKEEALRLAQQAYLPDFGLTFSITGSTSRTAGGMLVLPTRWEAIRAGIRQAQAGIRAAEAARKQYERDLAASFVLNLSVLRNGDRQIALFEDTIIPRARETMRVAQAAYAVNQFAFADLVETQKTLLDARLVVAQLRTEREKALAAIESWSAVDVETLQPGRISVWGASTGSRTTPAEGGSAPGAAVGGSTP